MNVTESRSGGILVSSIAGRLEGTRVKAFSEYLTRQIDSGENRIVLECSQVKCLADPAIRVLMNAACRLHSRGGILKIAGLRPAFAKSVAALHGPVGPLSLQARASDALLTP